MQPSRRTKIAAIAGFVLVALVLWLPTIVLHFVGFVAPTNGEATGLDMWALLVWAAFLYAAHNLWRAFRKDT
jgi:membrane protein implicated in regulation of membrane protease activity